MMKKENQNDAAASSQNLYGTDNCHRDDTPKEGIPDEVPRKDGPGGE